MKFIIKMEDRFARSDQLQSDVEHNVRYIRKRSLPHTNIKLKVSNYLTGVTSLTSLKVLSNSTFSPANTLSLPSNRLHLVKYKNRLEEFSNEVKLAQKVEKSWPFRWENTKKNWPLRWKKGGTCEKRDNYFTRNSYARDENGTPWVWV